MLSDFYLANHKWSICGGVPSRLFTPGRANIWFCYTDSQTVFCLLEIFMCVRLSNNSAAHSIASDSAASLNSEQTPQILVSIKAFSYARRPHPSAQPAALLLLAGSDSGHQADPSQLPEDMVHTGRDRRLPNRIHTVVCGNNEQTVDAAKQRAAV